MKFALSIIIIQIQIQNSRHVLGEHRTQKINNLSGQPNNK